MQSSRADAKASAQTPRQRNVPREPNSKLETALLPTLTHPFASVSSPHRGWNALTHLRNTREAKRQLGDHTCLEVVGRYLDIRRRDENMALNNSVLQIFQDIKSPNKDVKIKAAQELLNHVNVAYKEMPPDRFAEFHTQVQHKVAQLVVISSEPQDKISGMVAVEYLLLFKGEDSAAKTSKYSGYLKAALRCNDAECIVRAAELIGKLARPGGALTAELVDSEVKNALEWLQVDRHEFRRLGAVTVVRELGKSSPTLMYAYVPQILECIWPAVRDLKVFIREMAADAAGQCIKILAARDKRLQQTWFTRMYKEAASAISQKNAPVEQIHGALLIIRQLYLHGGLFMQDRQQEVCEMALQLKSHREPRIRNEIVQLIPILARYHPANFSSTYLHKFMVHLSGQLKVEKERSAAFIAIGRIAQSVGGSIGPYLDSILSSVRSGLSVSARRRSKDGAVFECISSLAIAVGQTLTKYMDALIDPMFACGLSSALTQAFVDLAHYVPPFKPTIQEKLLDLLSLVLCGRPFRPLGCPENRLPPVPAFARDWQQNGIVHGDAEVALALSTLGSFDFKGHLLNEFVRDVVLKYLKSPLPHIRKAAALTSCQIYVQDPIIQQTSNYAMGVVRRVIQSLLKAGVSDPLPELRVTILNALDPKFDRFLAEQENVRKIVMAVNDSHFEVRTTAISMLGRLVVVNPAYVMPPLRKILSNFTMGIRNSKDPVIEEESAKLMSLCVQNTCDLVAPFVDRFVNMFLCKTTDPNPTVASAVLRCIGDLSALGGPDMKKYVPRLMPVIIDALQDLSSPNKRDAALQALGQLASNSGYVIAPYLDYPPLLDLLTGIIKTEQHGSLRRETIKLLGILGALDPYKHQQTLEDVAETRPAENAPVSDVMLIMQGITPSSEEYYPAVVMNTLMANVLKDTSLAQYHGAVIEAIVSIFKTLNLKCVSFLPQIIPTFVAVINSSQGIRYEQYFNQLAVLTQIVGEHMRPHKDDLVQLIIDHWHTPSANHVTMLSLIEALSKALQIEFYESMVKLLPLMLDVLDNDTSPKNAYSLKVLHTLLVFDTHIERSLWQVIPKLVKTFQNGLYPLAVRKQCIETIDTMARQTNISDYCAILMQGLLDALASRDRPIANAAYECVLTLIFEFPADVGLFLDSIKMVLVANNVPHPNFDQLVAKVQAGQSLPQDLRPPPLTLDDNETAFAEATARKLPVNQEHLKQSWDASNKSTREDWQEWMRRFSIELLKESPSNALRACASLASVYQPLARDLFNSAFVSCWTELYDQYQEDLVRSLEIALTSPQIPPEILQVLLNLAEFMEHDDKPLPIDIGTLGIYAGKCHAFAKALHYKELEFEEEKSQNVVEALISINNQLQQTDAAVGILKNAQNYRDFELKETWYEKLGRWDEALDAYQTREKEVQGAFEVTMGKMRCLHALGEWDSLSTLAREKWPMASVEHKRIIAPLAAAAAWGLHQWELMDNYLDVMKPNSPDRSFFGAISALHQDHYDEAKAYIEKVRDGLDTELSALLGESYTRAYGVVVRVQMLAELEEIITYKKNYKNPERQATMRETWKARLEGCEGNLETWQRMLKVRQLVLSPKDNVDLWIKFANLCRKSGRAGLAERTIRNLKALEPDKDENVLLTSTGIPEVTYAQKKYEWSTGDTRNAIRGLLDFANELGDTVSTIAVEIDAAERNPANPLNLWHQSRPAQLAALKQKDERARRLLSKCYLKLGKWETQENRGDWREKNVPDILKYYKLATDYNSGGQKAWHAWALANFEVVNAIGSQAGAGGDGPARFPRAALAEHVIPAIKGFYRSIALSTSKSTLQDTLRVLTLWFAHGADRDVCAAVLDGCPTVGQDTWLEVIPQLIARINQPVARVRAGVQDLLVNMGRHHPQALVYPLTVAMKSEVKGRSESALAVMNQLRLHSRDLVDQAQLVSRELIRVAVLWHELWHEALEEASRLYFGDNNAQAMFEVLEPLHKLLEAGPQTLREISFTQAFGRELKEARQWCHSYRKTGEIGDINQAWDLYYTVFKRINRQLHHLVTLDLKYVSPQLKEAKNLELAVPGTYQSGKPIVQIVKVDKIFTVIQSKQCPRKMNLTGSDGQVYTFVLKGKEDIRQDERVMQLFGLVNTLLNEDTESFKRHLNIQRFPAIPLSQKCGLIGWVPNSDTLHNLIKDYRDQRRILVNIEHRIMLQMAPDYDNLTLMQKVEVFSYAMDNTTGKDLYRILWLKSRSSEAWLERRTNYTRSLAVMSMVGYILGLGDRHPRNLLMDRVTGKIVHIDFGDCFEIAMNREKYPERVPFRLTRMFTYAMEVSNIEGSFKISSEAVMRVIRENKESLLAVLEAFIHDPLLNWRLTNREASFETSFIDRDGSTAQPGAPGAPGDANAVAARRPTLNADGTVDAGPPAATRPRDGSSFLGRRRASTVSHQPGAPGQMQEEREVQNARALQVLERVKEKLNGRDFGNETPLDVEEQVMRLISQATDVQNICQHFIGWCAFW